MHGFLNGLIGTGLGPLLAGIAWMVAKHRKHAPGIGIDDFIFAGCVVAMLLAGDLTAATGAGKVVTHLVSSIAGYFGKAGLISVALITGGMLLKTVIAVCRKHGGDRMLYLAFGLPLMLALFPTGIFHSVSVALTGPANSVAVALSHAMGV